MQTIMASKFKEHCLALIDQVARTREPIIITKHGRPVARLMPLDEESAGQQTMGSVSLLASEEEAYYSAGVSWDANAPEREAL